MAVPGILYIRMTAASSPSPFVASASTHTGSNDAWQAFTIASLANQVGLGWYSSSGVSSATLSIDLGEIISVGGYKIMPPNPVSTYPPKTWTFEGSNDNSSWTVLDTQTNITVWTGGLPNEYALGATASYRYYRLNISANNGNTLFAVLQLYLVTAAAIAGGMPPIYDGMRDP